MVNFVFAHCIKNRVNVCETNTKWISYMRNSKVGLRFVINDCLFCYSNSIGKSEQCTFECFENYSSKKCVKQFHQNLSLQPDAIQVEASCKPYYDCHTKQHCLFPFAIKLYDMLCFVKPYTIPFLIQNQMHHYHTFL